MRDFYGVSSFNQFRRYTGNEKQLKDISITLTYNVLTIKRAYGNSRNLVVWSAEVDNPKHGIFGRNRLEVVDLQWV